MSYQDICYQRLINLHQPGGESTLFDEDNLDKKLTIQFTKGGLYTDKTYLEGKINNLKLDSTAVAAPGCFVAECVAGGGIWTTAITSSISRVNNNNITEYWIEGSLDTEGNLWVLDLGIINQATGDFIIKDKAVFISNNGEFKSNITLSESTKVAILKKVNYTTELTILHYIGQYKSQQRLSRTKVGYLLKYNAIDQQTDLELLSLSLLSLLFSTYKHIESNTTIYYTKGELDYKTKQIIEDNLSVLSGLLDLKSTSKRINSIPKTLTTYIDSNLLYEDSIYLNNLVSCVDDDYIESACLESKEVYLTSSKEVSTKAVAWFYILIYTYTLYFNNNKYTYLLDLLAYYLENQINNKYNLPSQGWTHANVLDNSTEILNYNLSTAVITYIVFLKHYDYTNNSHYLELATNVEEAIWNNLYNFKSKLFTNNSVEELAYGLLFSNLSNKVDVVENILTYIENNLTTDYGLIKESINGINIVNLNKLSAVNLELNPSNLNFTTLTNPEINLLNISKVNLLLTYSIQLSQSNNYFTSIKLKNYVNVFLDTLNKVEKTNILPYICACISNTSLFNLEVISKGDYYLTSNLSFERSLVLNKLLDLPTEFGWFTKKALQLTGNVYKLFNTLSKSLTTFSVVSKDIINNNNLSSLKGFRLSNYLSSFKMFRLPQELDSEVIKYYVSILAGEEDKNTKSGINKRLSRYNIISLFSETYNKILKINSIKNDTKLGQDYLIGNQYASTNIVEITSLQPLNSNLVTELRNALPIATKCLLNEVILLEYNLDTSFCVQNSINNSFLLLESNELDYLLLEDGSKIIVE